MTSRSTRPNHSFIHSFMECLLWIKHFLVTQRWAKALNSPQSAWPFDFSLLQRPSHLDGVSALFTKGLGSGFNAFESREMLHSHIPLSEVPRRLGHLQSGPCAPISAALLLPFGFLSLVRFFGWTTLAAIPGMVISLAFPQDGIVDVQLQEFCHIPFL